MRPTTLGGRARPILVAILGTAVAVATVSCLPEPVSLVPEGTTLECFVTVRGGEEGELFEQRLRSRGPEFVVDDVELRRYHESRDCADGFAFEAREAAEADWRLWTARRVSELAEEDPASVFALLGGTWCEVPDTLSCEEREPLDACLETGPELTNDPLPRCPVPPGSPGCLAATCNGSDCAAIDFGPLDLATADGVTVAVANCGGAGAPDVEINYDGTVIPVDAVGGLAEFVIPIGTNECFDAMGALVLGTADAPCAFEARFEPATPGEHAGRTEISYQFVGDPEQRSHEILLDGVGDGRRISLQSFGDLCFDALIDPIANPCTEPQDLVVENDGNEALDVLLVEFGDPLAGFGAISVGGPPPRTLRPGDQDTVKIRWCEVAGGEPEPGTTVEVQSSDLTDPVLVVNVERRVTPCP